MMQIKKMSIPTGSRASTISCVGVLRGSLDTQSAIHEMIEFLLSLNFLSPLCSKWDVSCTDPAE